MMKFVMCGVKDVFGAFSQRAQVSSRRNTVARITEERNRLSISGKSFAHSVPVSSHDCG